jgi:hypothetical protein
LFFGKKKNTIQPKAFNYILLFVVFEDNLLLSWQIIAAVLFKALQMVMSCLFEYSLEKYQNVTLCYLYYNAIQVLDHHLINKSLNLKKKLRKYHSFLLCQRHCKKNHLISSITVTLTTTIKKLCTKLSFKCFTFFSFLKEICEIVMIICFNFKGTETLSNLFQLPVRSAQA